MLDNMKNNANIVKLIPLGTSRWLAHGPYGGIADRSRENRGEQSSLFVSAHEEFEIATQQFDIGFSWK